MESTKTLRENKYCKNSLSTGFENLPEVLKEMGFDSLRKGQDEAVMNLMMKRDTLCVMPTGCGKSAVYIVPTRSVNFRTLIFSPLVSLMKVEAVPDSTYDVCGGLEKQIREIKEVIELPVKHPELFESLGVSQPKGVLLYGPPGTGKTLLARACAHHTDCTFIRVSGAELVQKYIGEGARMVRELFVMAREAAPSIIFMD